MYAKAGKFPNTYTVHTQSYRTSFIMLLKLSFEKRHIIFEPNKVNTCITSKYG